MELLVLISMVSTNTSTYMLKLSTQKTINGMDLVYFTFIKQAEDISSKYQIDQDGSMASMRFIIEKEMEGFIVVLYNGDWDSVVPYIDTIKNLEKLDMKESYLQ